MTYTPNPADPTEPQSTVDASTAAAEFMALKLYIQQLLGNISGTPGNPIIYGAMLQPGVIFASINGFLPGSVLCDGSLYEYNQYPVVGALLGASPGGTFNVPDLRGRTIFGFDESNATGRIPNGGALLNTGGASAVVLNINQLPIFTPTTLSVVSTVTDPEHTHTITDPGHFHAVTYDNVTGGGTPTNNGGSSTSILDTGTNVTGITNNSNSTGITVSTVVTMNPIGGANAIAIMNPYMVMYWFIKMQ